MEQDYHVLKTTNPLLANDHNFNNALPNQRSESNYKVKNQLKAPNSLIDLFMNKRLRIRHPIVIKVAIGVFLIAVALFFVNYETFGALRLTWWENTWGKIFLIFSGILFFYHLSYFIWTSWHYFQYSTSKDMDDKELPSLGIIVPAYNEGPLVLETIRSIAKSNYPKEKLHIYSIDDGSMDDTWDWIQQGKKEFGSLVTIHQQPVNKGKRQALYYGFLHSKAEIFITIDSDSIIEKDTLRNLVAPFVEDPEVGAVAGNVRVLNNEKSMIAKMLDISFVFSFEFTRAAQSNLGTVLCTPGALSAYRKIAVITCLNKWINQKFMGVRSDIGEDRALTNMILDQGYLVKFQQNANVYTNVPEDYQTLTKMLTRWGRSNVRENLMMSQFAFGNFREGSKFGSRLLLINQWVRMLMAFPAIIMMLYFLVVHTFMFLVTAFTSIFIASSIRALFFGYRYGWKNSLWAYPYSIFYMFSLSWISPYAMATASKAGWLTRTKLENPEIQISLQRAEAS